YTGKGWGELQIEPVNSSPKLWSVGALGTLTDDANVAPNSYANGFGEFEDVWPNTPAVGFAVWERNFADQAGNYGRLVEHSTVVSSGGRI
ncbi:MAG: hypothetical protein P8O15_07740, partial [Luminiphilus sp.]|nr:hypothetical protein [Luminiphilus sp.]